MSSLLDLPPADPAPVAPARDMTRTEHLGHVDRVVFADPARPFSILALRPGKGQPFGETVMGPFDPDEFEPGVLYKFHGRWEPGTAKFGPRFNASTFTVAGHLTQAAIVKYLSRTCPGVTEATARKLYAAYGRDAIAMLRDDPAGAAAAVGLDPDKANEAADRLAIDSRDQEVKAELFGLFAGRGFPGKLIAECVDKWGKRAPVMIQKNPFNLLGLSGAGFKRCDRLWTDFKLPAKSLKRQVFCAWQLARTDRHGHTWLPAHELGEQLREMVPGATPVPAFKLAIRARRLARYRDADGATWVAEYNRAKSEERIALALARLSAAPNDWPTEDVPVSERDGDGLPSEHQVERLRRATRGTVGILAGGPGTGKTHTLAFLLKACIRQFGRGAIAVCAPTGKAAVRAKQAITLAGLDLETSTIHRLLGIGKSGHGDGDWAFAHNADNPLPFKVVVVDETSMIDADLAASLLSALPTGCHVLLIGDPYQLPPVGHGAPLRDLIAGGLPYGELTQVRRNAGLIVHACQRVKNAEDPEFADRIDLACDPPRNLRLIPAASETDAVESLRAVLAAMRSFHPVWQTQVICARNKGSAVGRRELNDLMQGLLNPDGLAVKGCPFRHNDKIICLRNSRMHVVVPRAEFRDPELYTDAANYERLDEEPEFGGPAVPAEEFVANGEIGRVVAVGGSLVIARFSERDRLVKIPIGKQAPVDGPDTDEQAEAGRGCNFDLAYAVTCHKLQGSEAPCVIVMVDPNAGMLCTREWHYTALSRASKVCLLIGQRGVFDKQRVRQAAISRKTFLAERVKEVLRV